MRLFIAVNFNIETKSKLEEYKNILKENSLCGKFTLYENLHLTIVFIGETDKAEDIKKAVGNIEFNEFDIETHGAGFFENKRGRGNIYFIGVKNNDNLLKLHKAVINNLKDINITIGEKDFTPHLTLGREVILKENFNIKEFENQIAPFIINVNEISLMKSERIKGKLIYSELVKKKLTKN